MAVTFTSNATMIEPSLLFEPYEDVGLPRGLNVTLDLTEGAIIDEAHEIAGYINQRVKGPRIAKF